MRKAADAEALAAELGDFFSPLVFDVTDPKAIAAAAAEVRSRIKGRPLMGLVNNAGAPHPMCPLSLIPNVYPYPRNLLVRFVAKRASKQGLKAWCLGSQVARKCYTPAATAVVLCSFPSPLL